MFRYHQLNNMSSKNNVISGIMSIDLMRFRDVSEVALEIESNPNEAQCNNLRRNSRLLD
jgi:hypothetical protein